MADSNGQPTTATTLEELPTHKTAAPAVSGNISTSSGYHIKLTGHGFSLDREIPEDLASRITMIVLSGGKSDQPPADSRGGRGGAASGGSGSGAAIDGRSIREVLNASKATKITQKMTVIGHYLLETESGKQTFSLAELKKGFENAKEPFGKNPSRDINKAIKLGWIAEKDKDSYYITGTGIQAVENTFPKATRKRRRKNNQSSSAETK
jgi:hypothetical protein